MGVSGVTVTQRRCQQTVATQVLTSLGLQLGCKATRFRVEGLACNLVLSRAQSI